MKTTYTEDMFFGSQARVADSAGMDIAGIQTQKEVVCKKNLFFLIQRYIRDIIQGQKIVPDLLES